MAKICNAGAKMSLGRWWLWALLGLLALFLLMQYFKWRPIEADIQSRTQSSLNANGFSWATTDLHNQGRDVLLKGQAPSEEAVANAMRLTRDVAGVRTVSDNTSLLQWLSSKVALRQNQNNITLSGSVPNQATIDKIVSGVSSANAAAKIDNQLIISDTANEPTWLGKLVASLPVLGSLRNANIQAEDGKFSVSGDVENTQEKQSVLSRFTNQFGNDFKGDIKVLSFGPTQAEINAEKLRLAEERRRLAVEAAKAKEAGRAAAEDAARLAEQKMIQLEKERTDDEAQAAYLKKEQAKKDRIMLIAECQTRINNLLLNAKIRFSSASAQTTAQSESLLISIGTLLKECNKDGVLSVQISGHTDSTGRAETNLDLSQQRASTVLTYLTEFGVNRKALSAVGFGETQPIADNATADGRAVNRRIQFNLK